MNIDLLPPGERAQDELQGSAAIESLHDALLDITGTPRVKFANVKDIEAEKVGRWIVLTVKPRGTRTELPFRITKAMAKCLKNRLRTVLDV